MNALSSSFLSPLPQYPKIATSLLTPSSPNVPHHYNLHISSSIRPPEKQIFSPTPPLSPPAPPLEPTKNPVKPSFPANVFRAIDDFINIHIDPPTRPCVDPMYVLSDNFAPVDELPPTECPVVEGSLPSCLNGAYIRNGPNPQFFPRGPYGLYDGDGMLHSIRIFRGKAIFCSRFVKTYKYMAEKMAGSTMIPNFFSDFYGLNPFAARSALLVARIVTGQVNLANGMGVANTSLALFGGNLYALAESDLPYAIKLAPNGDIITLGRHDFNGLLKTTMTAHPKIDPETHEVFAFRYGVIRPFLTFFRINPNGTKEPDVKIFSMTRPTLTHDFAITKKYAIFPDIQIGINPLNFFTGKSPICSDVKKVPRLGVIPRYAKDESEMKWFYVPGLNVLHTINAWDEDDGDTIVIVGTNMLSVEHLLERMDLVHGSVEKIKIDLKTGMVWRHPLSTRNLELPVINPAYVGKKNRYAYAAIADPMPKISGVVKLDLSLSEGDRRDSTVATRLYGPGCYGGEPFFVAKEPNGPNADEDEGYVLCYVHDENSRESRFLVMDAKSPHLEIVASVRLPQRVPCGFHGLFVRESDLNIL